MPVSRLQGLDHERYRAQSVALSAFLPSHFPCRIIFFANGPIVCEVVSLTALCTILPKFKFHQPEGPLPRTLEMPVALVSNNFVEHAAARLSSFTGVPPTP